jgi:hypothetical protein
MHGLAPGRIAQQHARIQLRIRIDSKGNVTQVRTR